MLRTGWRGVAETLFAVGSLSLGACGGSARSVVPDAPLLRPVASIQELMMDIVDPAADGVWNATATVITASGTEQRQPATAAEWAAVRSSAITLIEAGNLLAIRGRHVGAREFPAESSGALGSAAIEERIDATRPAFEVLSFRLSDAGRAALAAIDARDLPQLLQAGGDIDAVCEACHLAFWYPGQVIPAFPKDGDPDHRMVVLGVTP